MGGLPEEIRPCQRDIQAKQTPLSEAKQSTAGCNSSGKVTKQDASRAERFLQVDSTSQVTLEGNPQKW